MLRFSFLPLSYQNIVAQFEPDDGNPLALLDVARSLESEGNLEGAATIYDRAYGLDQRSEEITQGRQRVLDQLSVTEHGIRFRYVPGGVYLMGTDQGEPDEAPLHPVWLDPFWMSETPISWATYCRLMDWEAPPSGYPRDGESSGDGFDRAAFHLHEENKIRLQYCEDKTLRARGWHSHARGQTWSSGGESQTAQELFGAPEREDSEADWRYETKPMVAVGWNDARELATVLSTETVQYSLPTEAQWEKAARGGLIGAAYPWGDDPPTEEICDFGRFRDYSIRPTWTFPPNGYGLFAMSGGVWEWTLDWYDAQSNQHAGETNPQGPDKGEEKALRGGSWADCAEAVTVTYRMSRQPGSWKDGEWSAHLSPTIGFRLCRRASTGA